jgi:hypothetical protein
MRVGGWWGRQPARHFREEAGRGVGFGYDAEQAGGEAVSAGFSGDLGGDGHQPLVWMAGMQTAGQLQTVHVGQLQVNQHQIKLTAAIHGREGRRAGFSAFQPSARTC